VTNNPLSGTWQFKLI